MSDLFLEAEETAAWLERQAVAGENVEPELAAAAMLIQVLAHTVRAAGADLPLPLPVDPHEKAEALRAQLEVRQPDHPAAKDPGVFRTPLVRIARAAEALQRASESGEDGSSATELRLTQRQINNLRELGAGAGEWRGESHPTNKALRKMGLAHYERRRWSITAAGRQWLVDHDTPS